MIINDPPPAGPTRRRVIGYASVTGLAGALSGAAGGAAGGAAIDRTTALSSLGADRIGFYGAHQAGILAPAAGHAWMTAFDLAPGVTRAEVAAVMRAWTSAAERLTAGQPPADDDAMTTGYGPASLTITVGFGASLLTRIGLPVSAELAPLPPFPGDALDPGRGDGDLGVLLTGNDAVVVAHALRSLARLARPTATVRWQITGFGPGPGVLPGPSATPRNLMGQLDGTGNPAPTDPGFAQQIFAAVPTWMRGGSYLVVRRIRMLLDAWDQLSRTEQERVIGRRKDTGAPLSGGTEKTPFDLNKQNPDGSLAIPPSAHIRQAAAASNNGATVLRRSYSYHGGYRSDGSPDTGLLFLAFQADPRTGFVPIQQRLAMADALSRFIRHESSALFAVPGGCRKGDYLGQALLD